MGGHCSILGAPTLWRCAGEAPCSPVLHPLSMLPCLPRPRLTPGPPCLSLLPAQGDHRHLSATHPWTRNPVCPSSGRPCSRIQEQTWLLTVGYTAGRTPQPPLAHTLSTKKPSSQLLALTWRGLSDLTFVGVPLPQWGALSGPS